MLEYLINLRSTHEPAFNGSAVIRHFEGSDAIEIRDEIAFEFYMGLPHTVFLSNVISNSACTMITDGSSV